MESYKIFLIVLAIGSMGVLIYAIVQKIRGHNAIMNELKQFLDNPYYMTLEGSKEAIDICVARVEDFTRAGDFDASQAYRQFQSIFSKRIYELTTEQNLKGLKFDPINAN